MNQASDLQNPEPGNSPKELHKPPKVSKIMAQHIYGAIILHRVPRVLSTSFVESKVSIVGVNIVIWEVSPMKVIK